MVPVRIDEQGNTKDVPLFSWEACLAYVDDCTAYYYQLRHALGSEPRAVAWLRRRDELIRAEMACAINAGHAGTVALAMGWKEDTRMRNRADSGAAAWSFHLARNRS